MCARWIREVCWSAGSGLLPGDGHDPAGFVVVDQLQPGDDAAVDHGLGHAVYTHFEISERDPAIFCSAVGG